MFYGSNTIHEQYWFHQEQYNTLLVNDLNSTQQLFFAKNSASLFECWTVQMRIPISFTCKRFKDSLVFLPNILYSVQGSDNNGPIFFFFLQARALFKTLVCKTIAFMFSPRINVMMVSNSLD